MLEQAAFTGRFISNEFLQEAPVNQGLLVLGTWIENKLQECAIKENVSRELEFLLSDQWSLAAECKLRFMAEEIGLLVGHILHSYANNRLQSLTAMTPEERVQYSHNANAIKDMATTADIELSAELASIDRLIEKAHAAFSTET